MSEVHTTPVPVVRQSSESSGYPVNPGPVVKPKPIRPDVIFTDGR